MSFYTVVNTSPINLNEIEYSLLKWKINNKITYLDMIIYNNEELITFSFTINNTSYKLKIIYNNRWILEFDQDIDHTDNTHLNILNMIDEINSTDNIDRLPKLIMDIIEIKIEETNF